jgi:ABC-type Fe3+-siderophore transport system permease subunit
MNCTEVSKFLDEHAHFWYNFIVSQTQIASGIVTCMIGVPTEPVLLNRKSR